MYPQFSLHHVVALLMVPSLAIALIPVGQSLIAADPSVKDPKPPIPIHGFMEEAQKLFEEASKSDEACSALYQQMKKGAPKPDLVAKLSMNVSRLKRFANRLVELGEPAGVEFLMRHDAHELERAEAFNALMGMPKIQPVLEKAALALKKGVAKRTKKAEEAISLAATDAIAAQNLLDPAYDEYESIAGALPTSLRGPFMELPLAFGKVDGPASVQRRRQVDQAIDAATSGFLSELEGYYASCKSAVASLQDGTIAVNEKSFTGPEFAEEIMRNGFVIQARMQKTNAIQHFHSRNINTGNRNTISSDCEAQLTLLRENMLQASVLLIEKDMQSTPTNQLLGQIGKYTTVLGKYVHRSEDDQWIQAIDNAILKASARDKETERLVRNYQECTTQTLKWKERFASKQEKVLTGQFSSLAQVVGAAAQRTDSQPGYIWSVSPSTKLYPLFYNPTFVSLPLLGEKLGKDAPAIVPEVVRLDLESPVWISRWDNYIYGRFPNDFYKTDQPAKLKKDLMITDTKPPLSVRAASAVYTAERGDGLTIGGLVGDVTAEGALMRMVATKDTGAPFTGISRPVSFQTDRAVDQVSLRANVIPKWYRHRYFAVAK